MLADLNELIAQRDRGKEPDLDGFLDKHGQYFPEQARDAGRAAGPAAARMAAASRMMASLSPEQRDQLRQLMDSVLDDPDLQFEMMQLEANLARRPQPALGPVDLEPGGAGRRPRVDVVAAGRGGAPR